MTHTLRHRVRRVLAPAAALVWAVIGRLALAQAEATCTLNGRPVPCEEFYTQVKRFAGIGTGLFLVIGLIALLATILWILMIVHAASKPIQNKALWIILLIFTGIVGALVYYFAVKRPFDRQAAGTAAQ